MHNFVLVSPSFRGVCLYAMLTGKLPFLAEPSANLTLLHSLILRGATIPDFLSDGQLNASLHIVSDQRLYTS